ncbi:GNAT family N-acetyltransferase [Lysobacter sp.]|uniref:GNAT family N-acetyltransferase n=1 Tax=Lysobacter sp. TaxID=72226 RepID=UPI002D2D5DB7|nr:GNAT family N-acetyltransferase [Lysobacter sp.]HZX78908.1 GNAT family N-acetyltransferase [Lysobacter sp.]
MDDMATSFVLRDVRQGDAAAISALVTGLSERWIAPDCTPDGASILLASMGVEATAERLRGDGYRYAVAELDGQLVGVAALRRPAHLYHLFVLGHGQRGGLARRLWDRVRVHAAPDEPTTVNASVWQRPLICGSDSSLPARNGSSAASIHADAVASGMTAEHASLL